MTPQITFKENSRYLLEQSLFNRVILECSYVEDNTVWFVQRANEMTGSTVNLSNYKFDKKKKKLYILNKSFCSWDNIEAYELTAYGSNDAVGQTSYGYGSYRVV